MYRVSFTGYRPQKLPFSGEQDPMCIALKKRLYDKIVFLYEHGTAEFLSGMALGIDTWCAEAVLALKKLHPEIKLTAVLPCRGQEVRWSPADQQRYRNILAACDKVMCLSDHYTRECMLNRNRALVDLCDILLAVYDGRPGGTAYTVEYARKVGRKVLVIPPTPDM